MMETRYHQTRFAPEAKRDLLWSSLWRFYFSRIIADQDCVIDLGCGYGNFINHVKARRRIAVDEWEEFPKYINPGVEAVVGSAIDVGFLEEGSVDFAFASNLFEHIPKADFTRFLVDFRPKLSERGTLNILQPNYRYSFREYFDDFTHVSVYSHVSMCDLLASAGYEVFECYPKFLPLTLRSRFPVSPYLIWLYLKMPVRPFGKQMFIRAR
jgi:SAM-dependent methyltransferase